jgi:hypothetical protein
MDKKYNLFRNLSVWKQLKNNYLFHKVFQPVTFGGVKRLKTPLYEGVCCLFYKSQYLSSSFPTLCYVQINTGNDVVHKK